MVLESIMRRQLYTLRLFILSKDTISKLNCFKVLNAIVNRT